MNCPSCGYDVDEEDDYCWHCGHEFDSHEAAAEGRDTDTAGTRGTGDTENTDVSAESRNDDVFAPLVHLLALFMWIFAPLVIFLATEDEFVKRNATNALNWQISYAVYMLISFFLIFFVIGIMTLFVVAFLDLIFCVVAAVKASNGEAWEYPFSIDLV